MERQACLNISFQAQVPHCLGFGEKFLEKDPLKEVAHEPLHLLDRMRHQRTTKLLSPDKEAKIEELVEKFIVDCKIKGIQVKHSESQVAIPW